MGQSLFVQTSVVLCVHTCFTDIIWQELWKYWLNLFGEWYRQEVDWVFHLLWLYMKIWPSLFSWRVFGCLSKSLFSFFVLHMDWSSGCIRECKVYVVACCQSQRADNSFPPGSLSENSKAQCAFVYVLSKKKNGQFLHSWLMCSTSICETLRTCW